MQTFRSARHGRPEGLHDDSLSRHEACLTTISSPAVTRTHVHAKSALYTPANQWKPKSELVPPVPLPKLAIESTT